MSGPGRRIGSGRLRVDAARAVEKLREYQLPDPRQWVLETIRAAVALGAREVRAFGDADDVWITWRGPTPNPDDFGEVLNELVSPSTGKDRRPLRLLAIGVNTALGLGPRWVDLWALDAEHGTRVRYTPKLLKPRDIEEDGAIRPVSEQHPIPTGLVAPGGAIHFRRFPGFEALGLFLRGAPPPELAVVASACGELAVPLEVGDLRLHREDLGHDLIRIPLGLGLDGFVALTDVDAPTHTHGMFVEVAEHGVVIARFVDPLPEAPPHGHRFRIPIRLFIDAPQQPTNASRSDVRKEESPVHDALERARALLPPLVEMACERFSEAPEPRLRASLIQLLAAFVSGQGWQQRLYQLPPALEPLADVALIRDALGEHRSAGSFIPTVDFVHRGREPVPSELAPWFHNVPWVPPGAEEGQLLGGWKASDASEQLADARQHLEAWQRWTEHPKRSPVVEVGRGQLLSVKVGDVRHRSTAVPAPMLEREGIRGEVCLLDPRGRRGRTGNVTLLLQGRPIASLTLESEHAFDAVLECDDLQPRPDYRDVVHDQAFQDAITTARAACIRAVELLASLLLDSDRELGAAATLRTSLPELRRSEALGFVRAAIPVLVDLWILQGATGNAHGILSRAEVRKSPLSKLPCWDQIDSAGNLEPIALPAVMAATASGRRDRPPALYCKRSNPAAPAGRKTLILGKADIGHLRDLGADLLCYDPANQDPLTFLQRTLRNLRLPRMVCLPIREEKRRGVVVWETQEPHLQRSHRGEVLDDSRFEPTIPGVSIAVDDDGIVPGPVRSIALEPLEPFDPAEWELMWLRAVVDALLGEETPLVFEGSLANHARLHRAVLMAAATPAGRQGLGKARFDALMELPLVPMLGPKSSHAMTSVFGARPARGAFAYLTPDDEVDFDTGDWTPLIVDSKLADAIGRLAQRRMHHAADELGRRRRDAARHARVEAHRRAPELDPPKTEGDSIELTGKVRGVARLVDVTTDRLQVEVRVMNRPFEKLTLDASYNLNATVNVPVSYVDPEFTKLTDHARKVVMAACQRAVPRILLQIAADDPTRLIDEAAPAALFHRWIRERGKMKGSRKARRKLFELPIFRTVQGKRAAVFDATTKSRVRVARFEGGWVGPENDDDAHPLDRPVLLLPEGQGGAALREVIEALADPRTALDHTRAVRALQSERLVSRGLVPVPVLANVDPARKATIEELESNPARRTRLGAGEVGLVQEGGSRVTLFGAGQLAGEVLLDLRPAFVAAIENLEFAEGLQQGDAKVSKLLEERLRRLGRTLILWRILPNLGVMPVWVRGAVRRAAVERVVKWADVLDVPLFETTADEWVTYADLERQDERFGDVWATTATSYIDRSREPLDPDRFAVRMTKDELASLQGPLTVIDARSELILDDEARRNRKKPRVADLGLASATSKHLITELVFENGPAHGTIGVLSASGAGFSGVHLHRDMRPLGTRALDCWPVIAKVEDPRLEPNRTHDDALDDKRLKKLLARIATLAERAVAELTDAPPEAIESTRVDMDASRERLMSGHARGTLWLTNDLGPGVVTVHSRGTMTIGSGLPVWGVLHATVAPVSDTRLRLESIALDGLGRMLHRLARKLKEGRIPSEERDIARAHLVTGLAGWVPHKAVRQIELPCFHPEAWTLERLIEAAAGDGPIAVVRPEDVRAGREAILDDDSLTSRAVQTLLKDRLLRPARESKRTRRRPDGKKAETGKTLSPSPSPSPEPPKPLEALASRLLEEIESLGLPHNIASVVVVDRRRSGLLRWDEAWRRLELSGGHPLLKAIEARRIARSVDADRAIALLAAHAVGVLNRAQTAITDATEDSIVAALLKRPSP